jgi:leucyl aminopeptidase
MKIEFVAAVDAAEILAVPVFEDRSFTAAGTALDGKANGALTKAAGKGRFTGKAGQSLSIAAPAGVEADAVLLVGAGAKDKLDDLAVEAFGGNAYAAVKLSGAEVLTIDASDLSPEQAARVGFAARLAAYRFDKYRTTQKADKIPSITTIRVVTTDLRGAEAALEPLWAVADGVIFARDLVSEPANVLYPAEFAKRVKALESLGLEVEILGEAEMEKLGMRTLLGVGQGSRRESQLAIIKWNGGEAGGSRSPSSARA